MDPSGYHPLVIAAIAIAGYLGTTAVETAPDVAIDYALDGEDFDLGSSFGSNFAMNLIPGIGELNKARKGAMLGKVAVKNLPSALGKRVKKQTTNKIGNALKIPEHINNAGKFVNWAKQFQKSKEPLSIGQVKDLIAKAKELGVKVEATAADLAGHIGKAGENWGIPHIHIGNARIHIPVPKGFKL